MVTISKKKFRELTAITPYGYGEDACIQIAHITTYEEPHHINMNLKEAKEFLEVYTEVLACVEVRSKETDDKEDD